MAGCRSTEKALKNFQKSERLGWQRASAGSAVPAAACGVERSAGRQGRALLHLRECLLRAWGCSRRARQGCQLARGCSAVTKEGQIRSTSPNRAEKERTCPGEAARGFPVGAANGIWAGRRLPCLLQGYSLAPLSLLTYCHSF